MRTKPGFRTSRGHGARSRPDRRHSEEAGGVARRACGALVDIDARMQAQAKRRETTEIPTTDFPDRDSGRRRRRAIPFVAIAVVQPGDAAAAIATTVKDQGAAAEAGNVPGRIGSSVQSLAARRPGGELTARSP